MIDNRVTFEYHDIVLIEKIKFKAPLKYHGNFQNRGCFIYFKDRAPKLLSSDKSIQLKGQEAVLLKCGSHFLDILKQTDDVEIEVVIIHLYPDLLKNIYIKELPALIEKRSAGDQSEIVASSAIISKFIESLDFYFNNPLLVNDALLELKIKELILLLVQSKNIKSIEELVSDLYSTKSIRFKETIKLHLYSNLNTKELATLCNMSLSSFKREFKKEFNDTPTNFINNKKLDKAKELLSITDISISEIAYEIGFNDPLYFTRFFKNNTGVSPTRFRNSQRH